MENLVVFVEKERNSICSNNRDQEIKSIEELYVRVYVYVCGCSSSNHLRKVRFVLSLSLSHAFLSRQPRKREREKGEESKRIISFPI